MPATVELALNQGNDQITLEMEDMQRQPISSAQEAITSSSDISSSTPFIPKQVTQTQNSKIAKIEWVASAILIGAKRVLKGILMIGAFLFITLPIAIVFVFVALFELLISFANYMMQCFQNTEKKEV